MNTNDDADALATWLESSSCSAESLSDWLQGYAIPPVGHHDEPYLWLLRAVAAGKSRSGAESRIATCLRTLLLDVASGKLNEIDRPAQMLYNAFMLAAGLNASELLFEPLFRIATEANLQEHWLGVNLRDALRIAVTCNQLGTNLIEEWRSLLYQREPRLFPGTIYDAFEGIVMMPITHEASEKPWLEAVGEALKEFARILEESSVDARVKFRRLLKRGAEARMHSPLLDRELVLAAHRWEWPLWAVECLPNLYIRLDENVKHEEHTALMWSRIAFLLPDTDRFEIVRRLCAGSVLEVRLGQNAARHAGLIASEVEPLRSGNPWFSISSVLGSLNDAVVVLEEAALIRGEHEFANDLRQKKIQIDRELRIAV